MTSMFLQRSHLFARLVSGYAPTFNYTVNGYEYTMRYYLAEDIYSSWFTFVETIQAPQGKGNLISRNVKKHAKMTMGQIWVCCNHGLLLFEALLVSGTRNHSLIS
jgi:hypothetical protein